MTRRKRILAILDRRGQARIGQAGMTDEEKT